VPLKQHDLELFQAYSELIDAHYREHWSLKAYSTELKMTPSRLADLCRRLSGCSPKRLLIERQIEEAKWQLLYTTVAISALSDDLGFVDPAYFCRFFTKNAGSSPSEYRRRLLAQGTLSSSG
jgi:AraC family 4-hydroxyphenylacetate 3-monooxygenase operon regulatory protein